MKKKLALVLCLVLCMTAFAGCSSAEIGYLNMGKDMMQTMPMHQEGSTEIYYDADALKAYIAQEAAKYDPASKGEIEQALSGFTGTKTIVLDYTGDMDMSGKDMSFVYDVTITIDKVKMPIGKVYYSMKNGIYADKDVLWNVYQLAEKLMPGYTADDAYRNDLKAALTKESYIQILSSKELSGEAMTGVAMPTNVDYMKIYEAAYKFLEDGFKDYTTNVVTEVPGGYHVSLTGDNMIQMTNGLLDYATKNFDTLAPAWMTYVKVVAELMDMDTQGVFDQPIDAQTKQAIVGMLTLAQSQLNEWIKAGNFDFLKALTYEETMKKSGDTYTSDTNMALTTNGKKIAYIKSTAKTSKATKAITIPAAGASLSSIKTAVNAVNNKHNPVKSAEVVWAKSTPANYNADSTVCEVTYTRDKNMLLAGENKEQQLVYKNIDQQMYLPLRSICESLDEEVGWDNTTQQAYIIRDGAKTMVTGVVIDDTTYIKVADFAKLGYKVVYDGSASTVHKSTISR